MTRELEKKHQDRGKFFSGIDGCIEVDFTGFEK
jgi:hypothetical protein